MPSRPSYNYFAWPPLSSGIRTLRTAKVPQLATYLMTVSKTSSPSRGRWALTVGLLCILEGTGGGTITFYEATNIQLVRLARNSVCLLQTVLLDRNRIGQSVHCTLYLMCT